jgi:4-amino-4-deoxy-L-arabinose transferase-like glycosyltransferase
MKILIKKHARIITIIVLILIAGLLRFTYLDRIPTAITGDELVYALTTKSVVLTGHDITGTWNPLSVFLFHYPPSERQAELPYFMELPFAGLLPFSLFAVRLPFALFSIGIVLLLFGITEKIVGKREALAVGLVSAVNPWLIFIGRTGYESTLAAFFYLLGLYLLITLRKNTILWTIPVFFLAFYSYIGTKLIFLPLVLLFCAFAARRNPKDKKYYAMLILSAILLTLFFVFSLYTSSKGQSRMSEILMPDWRKISSQVDEARRVTLPNRFTTLFINKWTLFMQILAERFFRIFSTQYLFLHGDQFFSIWKHGFFYIIDFFFLAIGIGTVFSHGSSIGILVFGSVILSTFVHVFNTTNGDFSPHVALMFPFMLLTIGAGITWCVNLFPKKIRSIGIFLVFMLYLYSIGNFITIYFFQHPLEGSSDFPVRLLTRYLQIAKRGNKQIIVYTNRASDIVKKYVFYTNTLNLKTIPVFHAIQSGNPIAFDGILFGSCDVNPVPINTIAVYDAICDPKINGQHIDIIRLTDGGPLYRIVNDDICRTTIKTSQMTLDDLRIFSMTDKRFCAVYTRN